MTTFVKICGMTSEAALAAAAAAGADAVGFVFAPSPRQVTPQDARELAHSLPHSMIRVAVMHHPPTELLHEVLAVFKPDWLQTDVEDLNSIVLPASCEALPVYRNGSVSGQTQFGQRIVFEGSISGSGQTADWTEAKALATHTRLILAGGLGVDNVAQAIGEVHPWGVDVSSGVERERGHKDPDKIQAFIAEVRALEN